MHLSTRKYIIFARREIKNRNERSAACPGFEETVKTDLSRYTKTAATAARRERFITSVSNCKGKI